MVYYFEAPLDCRISRDGEWFTLLADLVYRGSKTVRSPAGFTSDLATIPRLFWFVFPKSGPYNRAAVTHDWIYQSRMFSRARCDALFLEMMKADQVDWVTRWLFYVGVRCGGWRRY